MIDWLYVQIGRVQGLVEAGVVLLGVIVVAATYARTKAIVPTLGAVIFAAVVIWAVHHPAWFEQKLGEDFEQGLGARIVLERR